MDIKSLKSLVITLSDEDIGTFCSIIDKLKDNNSCIGFGKIKFPDKEKKLIDDLHKILPR